MATPCDKIELFADGELTPFEAEAFRDHLPTCNQCQVQLTNLLLLDRLGVRYVTQQPQRESPQGPVLVTTPARKDRPRWHFPLIAGAACAVAAAILLLIPWHPKSLQQDVPEIAWTPHGRTPATPRMSDPRVDRYRPATALMGGDPTREELPRTELDRLEERRDYRAAAAVYLAWNRPEQALDTLARLDANSPDVQSDRAAILISLHKYEDALHLLAPLLTSHTEHPQARWNRALVLEALGLPMMAARDFQEIARLNEDGWAQDAKSRAEKLISMAQEQEARWKADLAAGEALASTGHLPENASSARSPILRLYFYEAVRTRTSAEEVLALLPLAKTLDEEVGGDALQRYVKHLSQRDFSRRAPLAREYAHIRTLSPKDPAMRPFVDKVLQSDERDLIIGALVNAHTVPEHMETFDTFVQELRDPWFDILAAQQRAGAAIREGNFRDAQATLEGASRLCASAHLTYRCVDLELDLAHLYAQLLQPEEVKQYAQRGWEISRSNNLRFKERQFLEMLSTAARLHNDLPVARVYLLESLENSRGDLEQERYIHQNLARLEVYGLNFDRARAEIDQTLATGLPLTLFGAAVLVDVARQRPAPGDEAAMKQAMAAAGPLEKGEHALSLHHLGSFYLDQDRVKGRGLLRDAIREAEVAGPKDENSRHARTYSYTSLILDEAKAHDFDAAMALFGEELGLEAPKRCVLALTADTERSLLVVRGADGTTRGYYEGARTERLPQDLKGFVPKEALDALTPCEKVEALVRPPLQGRSGLLPPSFSWSYRTRSDAPRPPSGKSIHVVVMNVKYDRERNLPPLSWTPAFGSGEDQRPIEASEATPDRVLKAMEDATEIDLVTHGLVSPVSEASYLVLAKGGSASDTDELRVPQLREAKLKGAPLVVLAACDAGRTAPILYEPVSLPNALLTAGARAVLAATQPIPDLEASNFFNAVRERIRQGASPAMALRDERMKWLQQNQGQKWLDSVLLFE